MLTNDILASLKNFTANMKNTITLVLQTGEHEKRAELVEFLSQLSTVSENIVFEERDTKDSLASPISFLLEADGKDQGIRFSGLPGGHEFNSLILALLHSSGTPLKLDDGPFFKGKDVAVVGGGNSGIEAAIDLSGIVNSVTVFEFLPDLKADRVLIDQAESRDISLR